MCLSVCEIISETLNSFFIPCVPSHSCYSGESQTSQLWNLWKQCSKVEKRQQDLLDIKCSILWYKLVGLQVFQKLPILIRPGLIFYRPCIMMLLPGSQSQRNLLCYCLHRVFNACSVIKSSCLAVNPLISYKGWKRRMWTPRNKRRNSKYNFFFNCFWLRYYKIM